MVGFEKRFMDYLQDDFDALGLTIERYDGLLAIHGTQKYEHIICAHTDRHGLITLGGGEYAYAAQYIKEIKYGEPNRSSRKELRDIIERFEGEHVYGYDPETGRRRRGGVIESCTPCVEKGNAVFNASGTEGKSLRELGIGTPLAYARPAQVDGEYFKGQIDNALSVAMVYALFQNGYRGTALLACEEEIGKSWIHLAEYLDLYNIETKNLIVLDTSPYKTEEPIDKGRVIFRNRDFSEAFNPRMVSAFTRRCEDLGLLYQIKDEYLLSVGKEIKQLGSTELGRLIQNKDGRWSGTTVQIPTKMYHTSYETTTVKAIDNVYAFLCNILIDDPIVKAL